MRSAVFSRSGFRRADCAASVNRICEFGAYVGICDARAAFGDNAGFVERFEPKFPVFAAHCFNRFKNFALVGGRNFYVYDRSPVGIETFVFAFLAYGFKHAFVHFARFGVGAAGRREGIHNQVDFA